MRKMIIASLALVMTLVGCGTEEEVSNKVETQERQTQGTEVVEATTEVMDEDQEKGQEEVEDKVFEEITYENQYYAYTINLPGDWFGKYGVEENEEYARLYYQSESNVKSDIVTIFSIPEKDWEQDENYQLHYLAKKDGMVYYFVLPLDNPYDDEVEQREYSKMVDEAHIAMSTFKLPGEQISGSPKVSLDLLFRGFQTENYDLAAAFYGGEYEWIYEKTKGIVDVDPDDKTGILKAFIENLGGEVTYFSEIVDISYVSEHDRYQIEVLLVNEAGEPYAPFGDEGPIAFYIKPIDGIYKVMDLPSITTK